VVLKLPSGLPAGSKANRGNSYAAKAIFQGLASAHPDRAGPIESVVAIFPSGASAEQAVEGLLGSGMTQQSIIFAKRRIAGSRPHAMG
jgi:hypothetical protein